MRVSVLIPTYNRARFLPDAIGSVLDQTFRDFELIVVDDGSTDGTEELVRRFPEVRYVRQEHAGISAARNRALAEAGGGLITWLDSDDVWSREKLEKQVAYLDAHPECGLVFCRLHCFLDDGLKAVPGCEALVSELNRRDAGGTCISTACVDISLYRRVGGYSLDCPAAEDTEWLTRAAASGVDVGHCLPEALYGYRIHAGQTTFGHRTNGRDYFTLVAAAIRRAKGKA